MNIKDIMKELKKPFKADEVEWKPQTCGVSGNGPWVKVLTYIDARAIQERLDDVLGMNNWKQEYRQNGEDIICKLSIRVNDEWISKEDGASKTNYEGFKGGLSSAFKRVSASGFGIGRYLYDLEATFAESPTLTKPNYNEKKGWNESYYKKGNQNIYWKAPKLPTWALPGGESEKPRKEVKEVVKEVIKEVPKKIVFINREKVVGIKAMVKKHKDLEKEILASYGLTSASQIQDYQYKEIYEKIKDAIHQKQKEENKSIFGDKRFLDIVGADVPITINCDYKGKTPIEVFEIDPAYIRNYAINGYVPHLKTVCRRMMEKVNNEQTQKTS